MSIKSQKSLNDECSEIFEKSYSVRSLSDEDISCSDDEESLAQELLYKISPVVLAKLRRRFRRCSSHHLNDIDRKVKEVMRAAAAEEGIEFAAPTAPNKEHSAWIDRETFVASLENIFDNHKYTTHAHKLFSVLDPYATRKIWWRDLLSRVVAAGGKKTRSRAETWKGIDEEKIVYKQLTHCKRETIVKLVSIESAGSFCYVSVSRGGRVGLYSGDLLLLDEYSIFYQKTGVEKRVRNCWVTDALYMKDVKCLLISCSNRSLVFYDAATRIHSVIYCITGLPNIPTCLSYDPSEGKSDTSELMMGDERGYITRLTFLQPSVSLFYRKFADRVNCYFWMELWSPPHSEYCRRYRRLTHSRSVRRLHVCRDLVLSCSHDQHASLVLRYRTAKLEDYVFKFPRGVTCFHWIRSLQLVVTGAVGGEVSAVCGGVVGGLGVTAARAALLDVVVVPRLHAVIGYTSSCTLDIWNLYEETLMQTIKLKFPFLGVPGRRVEFGAYSIHPGPARVASDSENHDKVREREYWTPRDVFCESNERWQRAEVLVTAGDHVAVVPLWESTDAVLPPPATQRRVRRPSAWDQGFIAYCQERNHNQPEEIEVASSPAPEVIKADNSETLIDVEPKNKAIVPDIDALLEKADLKCILEKDFVKMMGLKHDLNKKMAAMDSHFENMAGPVAAGAPYLALNMHPLQQVGYNTDLEADYRRVLRLFPSTSSVASVTSSRSQTSTLRRSNKQ